MKKSYSHMRRDFYQAYKTKILPTIKQYEEDRKKALLGTIIISSIFAIIAIASFVAIVIITGTFLQKFIAVSLTSAYASYLIWNEGNKMFEHYIKAKIMPIVCSCFEDLEWNDRVDIRHQSECIQQSCIIPAFNSSTYDDVFTGSYNNVKIEIYESKYERTSSGGKYRDLVFKGVMVKLNMNKNFNSHTVIRPDNLLHISPANHLKQTTLEDVQFEKKFDVFTNDPVDARYLITPSFMNRLNNMETVFKASKVSCAFYNNQLFVALHTNKDLFSICSLIKPIDESQQYFTMYEEIESIIKLIDHFKLDQKIGL